MEKLLTVEQAGTILSVHNETVRQWLRSGKLRGVKMGHRSWRVPETALRELSGVSKHTAPPDESSNESTPSGDITEPRWDEFLSQLQALHQQLDAEGFAGVNGAESLNEVREARTRQLIGEPECDAS